MHEPQRRGREARPTPQLRLGVGEELAGVDPGAGGRQRQPQLVGTGEVAGAGTQEHATRDGAGTGGAAALPSGVDARRCLRRAAAGERLMSELTDAVIEQHLKTLKLPAIRSPTAPRHAAVAAAAPRRRRHDRPLRNARRPRLAPW